jgi:hypothetical protein
MNIMKMKIIVGISLLTMVYSDAGTTTNFCLNPIYYFKYDNSLTTTSDLTNCFSFT